jgi:drug/metabolite transporter (DMT)-like permease
LNGGDITRLVALSALWGGSFLFMRLAVPEFGPVALVFVRVAGAALLLLPWLLLRGDAAALRAHWRPIALIGLVNTALPFTLFAVAALALGAGLMAVFNSTAPLWTALIAWAWFAARPGLWPGVGLALGVAGVIGLSWDKAQLHAGDLPISPALGIAACVAASVLYGLAANLARRRLVGVPPLAVAAGSQIASALLLAAPALWLWPAVPPGAAAWGSAAVLALACTGLAYALYFRLIADVGATKAVSVTFLIPAFAMLWGALILGERPTLAMLVGCAVILLGTALSTGLLEPGRLLQRKRL